MISKLRLEVHERSTVVIDFKDSDEYRALLSQYQMLIQQLEASQKENRSLKEQVEQSRRESLAMTSQRESATVSIKYELESQKKEVVRLNQIIESLRSELENTRKENSQLLIIRQESGGLEYRIQSLTEEVNALRAALNERESTISKLKIEIREVSEKAGKSSAMELRLKSLSEENAALRKALSEREEAVSKLRYEIHETTSRTIDYKDSDDYRALLNQYQLVVQQLETTQKELRTIREQSEKFQREIVVIRNQSESGSSSLKYELESSKREVAHLNQIIESLRIDLENNKKQNSELLIIREQSGTFEYRVKALTEEVNALRAALNERENIISKLRIEIQSSSETVQKVSAYESRINSLLEEIKALRNALAEREDIISKLRYEVHTTTTRVINYKESDDYRALQNQYELLIQQLEGQQREARAHRENYEKSRQELLILKHQMESGSASIRFELESAKSENARLVQIIEALKPELENYKKSNSQLLIIREQSEGYELRIKSLTEEVNALRAALAEREDIISKMRVEVHQHTTRVINYKESDDYRALLKQYELVLSQLEEARAETRSIREQSEKYRTEIFMIKSSSESGTASLRYELDSAKAELTRLSQIIEALRAELDNTKKANSELLVFRQQSGNFELRIKSLTEEVNALRAALAEREDIISKMRMEVHQYSTRIINYKESDDYRALLKQYELIVQQLEAAKGEIRTIRDQSEKYRSEILVIKQTSESGTASIRFELESAKSENARLSQIIEALRVELENTKKANSELIIIRQQSGNFELRIKSLTEENNALRAALAEREDIISKMRVEVRQYSTRVINYKDSDDYRALQNQYEMLYQQLDAARAEIRTIREQSEKYRSEIVVIKSASESGTASIRFELESAKSENARLTQIIEAIRVELEKTKKENSELLIIRQQSGGYELRVKSLTEEVNALHAALSERENIISKMRIDLQSSSELAQKVATYELRIKSLVEEINSLRAALAEREENLSKMRFEINQYSTRVINYKDSDDYRTLLKQYELLIQQLEAAKVEIRTIREQSEKYRSEILVIKSSSESGTASLRFELESAKSEILASLRLLKCFEENSIKLKGRTQSSSSSASNQAGLSCASSRSQRK